MDPRHASEGGGESGGSAEAADKEEEEEKKVEKKSSETKEETSLSQIPSQIHKYTDTTSTHKLQVLQEASVNAKIEKAKKDFTQIFGKEELDFFEKLFRVANIAQDGFLNDSELLFFLDQHDYIISKQEARQIIKESDTNKDQVLDFSEFLGLCKKAELNLKEIGVLDKGETESQLQNSLKIRNIFRCIFECIGI
jgi:Ca2+-binding EF-hand superfamily protein